MKRSIFEKFKKDKDKPIAENPQFEAEQMKNDDSEKKKGFFAKVGAYCKSRKKQAAIVCILCVFALTAAGIGGYNAIVGDATQGGDKTVTIVDKDTGKEKVVKADSEEAKEAEENGDVVKETTKSSNAAKATEKKSNSNKKSPATSNSGSKKPASSSGGSSSSGGGNTSTTKPVHHHSWQAVYGERSVPYTATEYYQVDVCTKCGAENPSTEHLKAHTMNYESAGTKEVTKSKQVTKYKTEQYVKGYKCSCGATK